VLSQNVQNLTITEWAEFRLEAERAQHQQEQEAMRLDRDESLGTHGLGALSADDWGIVILTHFPRFGHWNDYLQ